MLVLKSTTIKNGHAYIIILYIFTDFGGHVLFFFLKRKMKLLGFSEFGGWKKLKFIIYLELSDLIMEA